MKLLPFLLALLLVSGCAPKGSGDATAASGEMPDSKSLRYLALGDSYTSGESVDPALRWPVQLVALLQQEKIDIAAPTIVAETGWTTGELMQAMDAARLQPSYDLVSVLIGVNNQFRGRSAEEYRLQFRTILQRAIALAGNKPGRVVVLSIPDWGVTPFAHRRVRGPDGGINVSQQINRFNAVNRDEAKRLGVHYVDITPESRQVAEKPDLIAPDGLHPSGKMYSQWASQTLTALKAAMRTDSQLLRLRQK